MLWPFIRCQP
ncbi:hypothetical protein YPPY03_0673, partial [Yersinia pestis PY-03]